eukprot:9838100-Heterocapsa_arctica.AAC.1
MCVTLKNDRTTDKQWHMTRNKIGVATQIPSHVPLLGVVGGLRPLDRKDYRYDSYGKSVDIKTFRVRGVGGALLLLNWNGDDDSSYGDYMEWPEYFCIPEYYEYGCKNDIGHYMI